MKKIKLTEATLTRIVERVIMEQEKEAENKELMGLFVELKNDPDNPDLIAKVAELTKSLGLPITPEGEEKLNV